MSDTIRILEITDATIAQRVLAIQRRAYRVEADLIGFDGIPPLHETLDELCASDEIFLGNFADDALAGVLSYSVEDKILTISRLIVHPDFFRRGIGKELVEVVEQVADVEKILVATGALNAPARRLYEVLGYQLLEEKQVVEGLIMANYQKILG